MSANARIIRGRVLSFGDDPAIAGASAYSLIEDGAVVLSAGMIAAVGEAGDVLPRAPKDAVVDDHASCLIMPGFIDAHVHYSQTQVIGSYGAHLLDWLRELMVAALRVRLLTPEPTLPSHIHDRQDWAVEGSSSSRSSW